MEYLYSQTGKTLTPVLQNPEEEDRLVEAIQDDDKQDEGFEEEDMEDLTVPLLPEDDPCRNLENRPSLLTSPQASPPLSPASPAVRPSTSHDGGRHPAPAPVLPGTSEAEMETESDLSDEAQVRHFNYSISMTFYLPISQSNLNDILLTIYYF